LGAPGFVPCTEKINAPSCASDGCMVINHDQGLASRPCPEHRLQVVQQSSSRQPALTRAASRQQGDKGTSQARRTRTSAASRCERIVAIENTGAPRLRLDRRNAEGDPELVSLEWTRLRDGDPAAGAQSESFGQDSPGVVNHRRQHVSAPGTVDPQYREASACRRNRARVWGRGRTLLRTGTGPGVARAAAGHDSRHGTHCGDTRMGWSAGLSDALPERALGTTRVTEQSFASSLRQPARRSRPGPGPASNIRRHETRGSFLPARPDAGKC
jgi:hypothetical protein